MQTPSKEQLRIKSLLYPWILFNLMNAQDVRMQPEMQCKLSFPDDGCYSSCRDATTAVVWDRQAHQVSIVEKNEDWENRHFQQIGFGLKDSRSATQFYEDGKLKPTSLQCWYRIPEWFKLLKSMLALQSELAVGNWEQLSQERLLRKVLLTFYAAVEGLNGLARLDPFSDQLMHHLPEGLICLKIDGLGKETLAYIAIRKGRLSWNVTRPEGAWPLSVDFSFKNLEFAWKSVANLSDNLSAVGKGDIRLRGYVPLADGLNHMLDRLQIFVKTS